MNPAIPIILLALAAAIFLALEAYRESGLPEQEPEPAEEAFDGPHPNGWPPRKRVPVAESHLGKTRLPDSERRAA